MYEAKKQEEDSRKQFQNIQINPDSDSAQLLGTLI